MHYAASVSSAPVFKAGQVHFPLFLMGYLYDPVGRINLDPIPGLMMENTSSSGSATIGNLQATQLSTAKASRSELIKALGATPLILLHFSIPLVPEEPFVD